MAEGDGRRRNKASVFKRSSLWGVFYQQHLVTTKSSGSNINKIEKLLLHVQAVSRIFVPTKSGFVLFVDYFLLVFLGAVCFLSPLLLSDPSFFPLFLHPSLTLFRWQYIVKYHYQTSKSNSLSVSCILLLLVLNCISQCMSVTSLIS